MTGHLQQLKKDAKVVNKVCQKNSICHLEGIRKGTFSVMNGTVYKKVRD